MNIPQIDTWDLDLKTIDLYGCDLTNNENCIQALISVFHSCVNLKKVNLDKAIVGKFFYSIVKNIPTTVIKLRLAHMSQAIDRFISLIM